jgi:hypothetical protein
MSLDECQELLKEFGWKIYDPSIHYDYKEARENFYFDVFDPSLGFPDSIGLLRHAFEQYDEKYENAPKIIKYFIFGAFINNESFVPRKSITIIMASK